MELTGKAKGDFEKFFNKGSFDNEYNYWSIDNFDKSHLSMRYGVYEDWLDSVGIIIEINHCIHGFDFFIFYDNGASHHHTRDYFKTRQEARTEAIKKANEIYDNLEKQFNEKKPSFENWELSLHRNMPNTYLINGKQVLESELRYIYDNIDKP